MRHRKKRLALALACVVLGGTAVGLVLWALRGSATFFYTPADLVAMHSEPTGRIRIGGLVLPGSVNFGASKDVSFEVTDHKAELKVYYAGVLPDLFRDGQGVVVEGRLRPGGSFEADRVLAKHDARYMPPELEKALKKRGLWHDEPGAHAPAPEAMGAPGAQTSR
jgi:cytochrome c-type biogenesis protein CcmE